MPQYTQEAFSLEINRRAVIIDTNVLVDGFCQDDAGHYEYVRYFLNDSEVPQFLIPTAVIVESWGFIVGKSKNWKAGRELLAWVNTPGKGVSVIPQLDNFSDASELSKELANYKIDYVDSVIYTLANKISTLCDLNPPIAVATYDTRDFFSLKQARPQLRFTLYDDLPPR
ncbi:MAG: PIN domain-containing protein [Cyanobacteria bacterium P01_F01_bin.53]